MNTIEQLNTIQAGMPIFMGGNKLTRVPAEIAARFSAGDHLAVVPASGEVLHIPAAEQSLAYDAVSRALNAFRILETATEAQIADFYQRFAATLEDQVIWDEIAKINELDVAAARQRGRSTTRLVANEKLRSNMISGLRGWLDTPSRRGRVQETVQHDRFRVELVGAALGVVAFVFEGRPNVLADACGVLRNGNTVVFRIGSDALRTAQAIMRLAVQPSLTAAGLPGDAVVLVESAAHAAGWALFCDDRLALAVARGSGPSVLTLGSLAKQAGIPASLHGVGGAWIVTAPSADNDAFKTAVINSLDRKVCNTLNTCCIVKTEAQRLVPLLLEGLAEAAQQREQNFKLHVVAGSEVALPAELLQKTVSIYRAEGEVQEPQAELLPRSELGREWEWEESPEITLVLVEDIAEAVQLFNDYSPQFVASLISNNAAEHQRFYDSLNAPFVGDSYTRWVDGQFALHKPELGLSNWQNGRLFGRGSILSGDSIYTLRTRLVST